MSRYVIRNEKGMFYSANEIVRTVPVPVPGDPTRNELVQKFVPTFETPYVAFALKYQKVADADDVMAHPDLDDAAAFDGCVVLQTEFDTDDMGAVRAVTK